MNAYAFVQKWRTVTAKEKSTYQSHFLDLCDLVDHGHPVAEDPPGEWFAFEPGIKKLGGAGHNLCE